MKTTNILAIVFAAALVAASARAQFSHSYHQFTNVPVPSAGSGGAPGGTSNPANAATCSVQVPLALAVTHLQVAVSLSHPQVGDLRIEVAHCGTSVVLYNQAPASTANLLGLYTFDDSAPTSFASAISQTAPAGTVPAVTYSPSSSLSAFYGSNPAGAWTVTVYDLAAGNTGVLYAVYVNFDAVTSFQATSQNISIPDGQNGQCLAPVFKVITVPHHALVSDMLARVTLIHPFVSDLEVTVQHAGVSASLSLWNAPVCSANVSGSYGFWDGATTAWTTAEGTYSGFDVIPQGTYRPATPLSVFSGLDEYGPWYLTVCDRSAGDVGAVANFSIDFSNGLYGLALTQPLGPAVITLTNSGGVPGDSFVNLFTLSQGSTPSGWVAGLDIPLADVIEQVSFGAPFTGVIGPCGRTSVTVGGPIPSGLTVWGVSLELDASSVPVATTPVFSYTTP